MLIAQIGGDQKASKKLMPWALPKNERSADAAEIAEAQAALDDGLIFSS
jgi:hypothetical protein